MVLAWARRFALGSAVGAFAGCGAGGSSAMPAPLSGDAGMNATGISVAFDNPGALRASPLQSVDVGVTVTGPDTNVTFLLESDYADASLSMGDVTTSGDHATVTLHAPSVAATFTLLARAAGAIDARLDVAVSASGFATVRVMPMYVGHRAIPNVVASAFVATTCEALAQGALQDGAPQETGGAAGPIILSSVPAGSHLAIFARVGHYASGCADVAALAPDASSDVPLTILDLPIAIDETNLESSFSFEPDATGATAWSAMLDGAITEAATAFVPPTSTEAGALLDAMRAAVPSASQTGFDTARGAGGWDMLAATWLGQHAPTLEARALGWLNEGKASDLGTLAAHLHACDGSSSCGGDKTSLGYVTVTLETFASWTASDIGMSVRSMQFAWAADANDTVHLSGSVHLWPTALVTHSADARAALDVHGATDVATAVAMQVDCGGLASAILGTATASYPGCGPTCTASLCKTGLGAMWSRASGASETGNDDHIIAMTASAPATVDDTAQPVQFSGAWVGHVGATTNTTFAMKGAATAQASQPVPH